MAKLLYENLFQVARGVLESADLTENPDYIAVKAEDIHALRRAVGMIEESEEID